jgi:HEPN domain-containing protein
VNQVELRQMAEERIQDAKILLDGGRWEFAYYAAGYAVECALKACLLARMIYTAWVFEEKWRAQDCLTHDFGELIKLAGLTTEQNAEFAASPAFVANWGTVVQWKVTSRYEPKTEAEARALHAALSMTRTGCSNGYGTTGRESN